MPMSWALLPNSALDSTSCLPGYCSRLLLGAFCRLFHTVQIELPTFALRNFLKSIRERAERPTKRSLTMRATALQGTGQRDFIGVFEIAANR